jgi:hypothetical protein
MGAVELTKATGFTLRLKETEDIVLTDGADNVADNAAVLVLTLTTDDFNANLGDTTTGTSAAKALSDASVLNFFL